MTASRTRKPTIPLAAIREVDTLLTAWCTAFAATRSYDPEAFLGVLEAQLGPLLQQPASVMVLEHRMLLARRLLELRRVDPIPSIAH